MYLRLVVVDNLGIAVKVLLDPFEGALFVDIVANFDLHT